MKKVFILMVLFCAIAVSAHEFWMQPDKFIYKKGEKANIRFRVGENFEGENWTGNRTKVNFLQLYFNGVKTDLSASLSDKKGDSLQYLLNGEGTALIIYSGLNSFIEMEPAKFNTYLEEDGLREIIRYRREHGQTDSVGRESYQRSVKTILQVGTKYDSTFKQATPLPLDIIPLEHPQLIRERQKMTVRVLFNKKPLAEQLVKIWYRNNNKTNTEEVLTDQDGLASFKIIKSGSWMVSTVTMLHLDNDPKAHWQSYWGSCTWGYE
ncbi:MAG: DUF4198 domain-containing protein [Bacteroidota bacterium]